MNFFEGTTIFETEGFVLYINKYNVYIYNECENENENLIFKDLSHFILYIFYLYK